MPLLSQFLGTSLGIIDSASVILEKIKTVDGAGSGLDAEFFSGDSINATTISSTNIIGNNITATAFIGDSVTGDIITATTFIGDGSQLTGMADSDSILLKAIAFAIALG